jgi:hypothetical protein
VKPAGPILALVSAVTLAVALALPLALRGSTFHLVPTAGGVWRGLSDPPGPTQAVVAALLGLAFALALARKPWEVRRPLLLLGLAAAPLVPLLTGRGAALLAFQGPTLTLVAAAALGLALARAQWSAPARVNGPLLFAAAFLFYALVGTRLPGPAGPQGDEPHYLTMAHSLLSDGDLDLANQFAQGEYREFFAGRLEAHTAPASPKGTLYPVHAPGLAVLILPAYALGGYPAVKLLLAALAALTAVLVWRLVRDSLGSPGLALAAWAALTLTPPLPFYALAVYPETPAALATAVLLLAARRDPGRWALIAAAVAAAGLPWLHPKFLPLAALGLGLVLARRGPRGPRVVAALAFLVSLGGLLVFFKLLYGRAALSAAYGPGFAADVSLWHIPRGVLALLLDRQFGLLAIGPLWALALAGAPLLLRQRPGDGLRAGLLAGASVAVGASFSMWWGGACPPARFVVPALPALALLLAPALRAHRAAAGVLLGLGLGLVALAADLPRALHNRPDGEIGLLRVLTPTLNLDGLLPSFVLGGGAVLLAVSLLAVLALALWRGWRGLLAGALAYGLLASALHERPWLDAGGATLRLLEAWDETRLWSPSGPPSLTSLAVPLDLRRGFGAVRPGDRPVSGRLDLPPGSYRVEVRSQVLDAAPHTKTTRLDLVAGEVLLEREYVEADRAGRTFPLLLPVGVRRMVLEAIGVQGSVAIDDVRVVPLELLPRGLRGDFPWPRQAADDRYRVGDSEVRTTAVDRCLSASGGFRLEGAEGAFVVEAPLGAGIQVHVRRPRTATGDRLVWAGRELPLGTTADWRLDLPTDNAARLAGLALVPVTLYADNAWIAFARSETGR